MPSSDTSSDSWSDSDTDESLSSTSLANEHSSSSEGIPSCYSSVSSDEEVGSTAEVEEEDASPRESLRKWALRSKIPHSHFNDLLKALKPWLPDLPADARTLLGARYVSAPSTAMVSVETIDFLGDFIRETNYPIGMTVETLKELLTRCTQNVQSLCNGQLYRQIDGVAMGSPLGPFLTNVFMGKVEKTSLQDTINDLKFYGRYVEDIFCLTSHTTDINGLVQKFNEAHPSLMFTAKTEANNEIAFLGVLQHRQEDGSIQHKIFRKKT
nr:unnamed protein product [Spirometra erinaceieuropaei]